MKDEGEPLEVLERPAPRSPALYSLGVAVPWALYTFVLFMGLEPLLRALEPIFEGTPLATPLLVTLILGGGLGWIALPLMLWGAIGRRLLGRYSRCEVFDDRIEVTRPLDPHRRFAVELGGLRLRVCSRWGVHVEADACEVIPSSGLRTRRVDPRWPMRLLVPCEPEDHARVLALLGLAPTLPPVDAVPVAAGSKPALPEPIR